MSWAFVVAVLVYIGVLHLVVFLYMQDQWTTIDALRSEQIRLRKQVQDFDWMGGCYRSVMDRLYVLEEKVKELDWTGGGDETETD